MHHKPIGLGVVGVGVGWKSNFRDLLGNQRKRFKLAGVYDAVAFRSLRFSANCSTPSFGSLKALASSSRVSALLMTDPEWFASAPVRIALEQTKDILFPISIDPDLDRLTELSLTAKQVGSTVMPAFRTRFQPAMLRTRELIATKLGSVQHIHFRPAPENSPKDSGVFESSTTIDWRIVDHLDWFRSVLGITLRSPDEIRPARNENTQSLTFTTSPRPRQQTPANPHATANTVAISVETSDSEANDPHHRITLNCEQGRIDITSHNALDYQLGDTQPCSEQIDTERSPEEIQLDHFARRVVGAIIPVPTLDDLIQTLWLYHAAVLH